MKNDEITPAKTWEKMPDVAPDNLPVGEMENEKLTTKSEKIDDGEIPFIPNLIAKTRPEGSEEENEPHPFEEKMKKVFTGASTTIGDLAIETPAPIIKDDPYREMI